MKFMLSLTCVGMLGACTLSAQELTLRDTLEGHTDIVSAVAFSPDGTILASGGGGQDATVRLWDVACGANITTFRSHTAWVSSVAFSADGRTLASGAGWDDKSIRLWDVASGTTTATFTGHTGYVSSVAYSRDGTILASGGGWRDNTIKLWDVHTGSIIATLKGHTGPVFSVAFSPDSRILASGGADKTIRFWDVTSHKNTATMDVHPEDRDSGGTGEGVVNAVTFSPDGKTLASGGWSRTLKLWDTSSGKITATLQGHTEPVSSVAFSPDGKTLVSGSKDHTIRLWDLATGKNTTTVSADTGEAGSQEPGAGVVSCVAFSPDGKILAAAIWDKTIRMWDVKIKRNSEDR